MVVLVVLGAVHKIVMLFKINYTLTKPTNQQEIFGWKSLFFVELHSYEWPGNNHVKIPEYDD